MLAGLLDSDGEGPTRQHEAAVPARTGRVAVIAGGPGTGKAAARLGEAVDQLAVGLGEPEIREALTTVEPSTSHRLLGWTWVRGRFVHHEGNRLPHNLVIVDEISMVSLPMAVLCARRKGSDGVSRWSRDLEIALDERFTGLR